MESRTYETLTKIVVVSTLAILTCLFILDGLSVWETMTRMAVIAGLVLAVRWMEKGKRIFLEKENKKLRLAMKGYRLKTDS